MTVFCCCNGCSKRQFKIANVTLVSSRCLPFSIHSNLLLNHHHPFRSVYPNLFVSFAKVGWLKSLESERCLDGAGAHKGSAQVTPCSNRRRGQNWAFTSNGYLQQAHHVEHHLVCFRTTTLSQVPLLLMIFGRLVSLGPTLTEAPLFPVVISMLFLFSVFLPKISVVTCCCLMTIRN